MLHALRVTEVELNFFYDAFYTKALVKNTWLIFNSNKYNTILTLKKDINIK